VQRKVAAVNRHEREIGAKRGQNDGGHNRYDPSNITTAPNRFHRKQNKGSRSKRDCADLYSQCQPDCRAGEQSLQRGWTSQRFIDGPKRGEEHEREWYV